MEGNVQELTQLPNTFRSRHQREIRTHLKQRYQNQNNYKNINEDTQEMLQLQPTRGSENISATRYIGTRILR